jgi:hypothetical protein
MGVAFGAAAAAHSYVIPISSQYDLNLVSNSLDAHYVLTSDVELRWDFTPIGTDERPFTGVFDGNGHSITNMTFGDQAEAVISSETGECLLGLFGVSTGTVKNLTIKNAAPPKEGSDDLNVPEGTEVCCGLIAAKNYGTIESCSVIYLNGTNAVDWPNITYGSIAGSNYGTISDCKVDNTFFVNVNDGEARIGMVAGETFEGSSIERVSRVGYIDIADISGASEDSEAYVGGIVGVFYGGTVSDCFNGPSESKDFSLTANTSGNESIAVGGIVGACGKGSLTTIRNSYFSNSVSMKCSGEAAFGGAVGAALAESSVRLNGCLASFASTMESGAGSHCGAMVGLKDETASISASGCYHYGFSASADEVNEDFSSETDADGLSVGLLGWDPNIWSVDSSGVSLKNGSD